jgi:hypothetical protein
VRIAAICAIWDIEGTYLATRFSHSASAFASSVLSAKDGFGFSGLDFWALISE